jgi:hypothetical protein
MENFTPNLFILGAARCGPIFVLKGIKKVDLEDQIIQLILDSTKEERRVFNH